MLPYVWNWKPGLVFDIDKSNSGFKMSEKKDLQEENLESFKGYTEEVKNDDSKMFACKQCEKPVNLSRE